MSGPWVRLWRDMPTDPKFRVIAKRSGRPLAEIGFMFVYMMSLADADGNLVGWHAEDAAALLDIDTEHVEAIHTAMQGRVLEQNRLSGWEKRQPKRDDDSRERVRAYRERKRSETVCNAPVTQRNAPEESRVDIDTDLEKNIGEEQLPSETDAAREEPDGRTPAYADLKKAFNGSTETMLAFIEGTMGHGSRPNAEQWLSATIAAHGQSAVAQAFAVLTEKRAAGEISTRPLPHWSALAGGIKARGSRVQSPDRPQKKTLSDKLAEKARENAAKAAQEATCPAI